MHCCIAILLLLPALSAAAAEVPLSLPPAYMSAPGNQNYPSMASDGDGFLVVWTDTRGGEERPAIYGSRVSSQNGMLDPIGIRIAGGYTLATVVWTGRSYLVILLAAPSVYQTGAVAVVRVDRDGTVSSPPRLILDQVTFNRSDAVAWNGSRVLMTYRRGSQDRFLLLDEQGNVVRAEIPLPIQAGKDRTLAASNGSGFLVLAQGATGGMTGVRIDGAGNALDAQPLVIAPPDTFRDAVVGSDGKDYLVLGSRTILSVTTSITRHIAADGQLGPLIESISLTYFVPNALLRRGGRYLALLYISKPYAASGLASWTLDSSGNALDTPSLLRSWCGCGPDQRAVAWNGESALVAGVSLGTKLSLFIGYLLGSRASSSDYPMAAPPEVKPAAAFDGANFLTAWTELLENPGEDFFGTDAVFLNRLSRAGERLDGAGDLADDHLFSGRHQLSPQVLFDGQRFVVAWKEHGTALDGMVVFVERVARDGKTIDPKPVALPSDCGLDTDFDMATDGKRTVVVWADCRSRNVVAARFDNAGGFVVDLKPVEVSTEGNAYSPRIAFGGGRYLVTWEERDPRTNGKTIRAARLLPDLFLLDHPSIDVAAGSTPAVAWNNSEFLVTYAANGIGGRFLSAEGSGLSSETIAAGDFSHPAVVYDGTAFVVVFEGAGDIYAARLVRQPTSTVMVGRFAVAATRELETDAYPVVVGTGKVALFYTRLATEPLYGGVTRVFMRMVEAPGRVRATR